MTQKWPHTTLGTTGTTLGTTGGKTASKAMEELDKGADIIEQLLEAKEWCLRHGGRHTSEHAHNLDNIPLILYINP